MREYAIWGTKRGKEDIIRINGLEVQKDLRTATRIKEILVKRNEFDKVRIQRIDMQNFNLKTEFTKGLNKKR